MKSIDRFGRNSKEIKRKWEYITRNIKTDVRVLDMPLLDTTQHKDKMGTFGSERKRENILQRQAEGIAVAKAQGKHLGRPQLNLITISKHQRQTLEQNYLK
ncbi:recombinase family protein [Bacillus thuringiensis]|uniref:recombinase family protein n=1 Tax=Bacillus thuringiensis TaxID=1428 RepID=UPI0021B674FE|nr:recombinase family protein [Bacillus thuringiensis]